MPYINKGAPSDISCGIFNYVDDVMHTRILPYLQLDASRFTTSVPLWPDRIVSPGYPFSPGPANDPLRGSYLAERAVLLGGVTPSEFGVWLDTIIKGEQLEIKTRKYTVHPVLKTKPNVATNYFSDVSLKHRVDVLVLQQHWLQFHKARLA
mgnify:CR=1 FL=1